ncbi:hypothetical protein GF359_10755 [candidate division WOR-3 bacterium]|uniref:D-isomer specific 2-hydroxyacid dehydrogenase NAD-binding domain-containing protein n=1 Tax=candidate division WOR-3 bacterium TaxID=2052148 RepID=A0A9D5QE28_UNCW3|nr:hypothetical protein [candidate division WOR-3 bacterium]MBD3365681.1 hypothetical protein [candidate division WOR-3 bacterium]
MAGITVLFEGEIAFSHKDYLVNELKAIQNLEIIFREKIDPEAYKLASKADVLVSGHPTDELLKAATNLKLHIVPFAGVQHVTERFREINKSRKVILVNAHWNDYPTAQHAVALLLALTNRLIHYHENMVTGKWRVFEDGFASMPLRDRNIGLLGYGRVNRLTHRFLAGFDCSFGALKRSWQGFDDELPTPVKRYTPDEFHSFLSWADILIIAMPMTPGTEGLIKTGELGLLGPDGLLVNVSRGKLLEEEDLYNALKERLIAGAGLDVWYNYRPEPDARGRKYPYESQHPFHELPNVVLSPHRGASPIKSLRRWGEVIENIRRFTQGKELINVVDLEHGY